MEGVVLALILSVAGCGGEEDGSGSRTAGNLAQRRVNVVTTIGMIADAVTQVGGERVEVIGLMGPGVDPHLYKASAGDVEKMRAADVIFYNGLHLEGAMSELFERMATRTRTVAVAAALGEGALLSASGNPNLHDPHVWFDVSLWMKATQAAADALIEIDPTHAEAYRLRTEEYLKELAALDAYVHERAAELPASRRVLITAHDAFHYFGRAYGFDVRGLQGISTVTEAGTGDMRELANFIVTRQIGAIFVESSVPRRTIEALQAAVKSRGFAVAIGGELFSDAMGNPGTPEGTYAGMVRHNIDTIVSALKGEAQH
jgi:manganese/zinc/iron transport system substrate-binding protein